MDRCGAEFRVSRPYEIPARHYRWERFDVAGGTIEALSGR
jgi:hypothetical protein